MRVLPLITFVLVTSGARASLAADAVSPLGEAHVPVAAPEAPAATPAAADVERAGVVSEGLGRLLRIALYDLDISDDVPERTARVFLDSLAVELRKLRSVDVVTMDEIRTMIDVEAQKQLLGCDEQSCLAEIADALGADVIITGSVAKVGEERLLGLSRIEQRDAAVSHRFQVRLEDAGGEELLAAVGTAVAELFPERALKEGVTRGVDETLALRLYPPPIPPWAFWTTTGLGAAAVTAGGSLLLLSLVPYGEAERLITLSTTRAVEASAVKGSYENANLLFVGGETLLGVGAAALVVAGAMFFFTDFAGVGDEG